MLKRKKEKRIVTNPVTGKKFLVGIKRIIKRRRGLASASLSKFSEQVVDNSFSLSTGFPSVHTLLVLDTEGIKLNFVVL